VRARHFGARPLKEDGSVWSASNTLTNIRLGYQVNAQTLLSLDIFNVFNRQANDVEYFYRSRLRSEPGFNEATTKADIHFHPSEPRAFRATLKITF
jgi:outer membrane receptor protein involved in Fe transport